MRVIVLAILLFGLWSSCETEEKQLTYADFEASLNPEMDYKAIVWKFGKPQKDIGSGIHIYVYVLNDSTQIIIGYSDKILYARHVDKDQNVLHTLI